MSDLKVGSNIVLCPKPDPAVILLVSSIFSVSFVVTSINTEKILQYVIKKNLWFLFFRKFFEVSFKFISELQHHIKKINSFIVRTSLIVIAEIEIAFDFDLLSDENFLLKKFSFLKKSISMKRIIAQSKSFDSKKLTAATSREKTSQKIFSRLIVKKIKFASLTSQKFVLF